MPDDKKTTKVIDNIKKEIKELEQATEKLRKRLKKLEGKK
jgi:ubiquinone biosynthesis protein UbiJ